MEKYAIFATFLCLITQLIWVIIKVSISEEQDFFSNETLLAVGKCFITAVVILIVAIPEGLPLAVSIAMALSIDNLKNDEILIKNLESIQTCATVHDICVGKTGTLTEGRLKVAKYQFCEDFVTIDNDRDACPNGFKLKDGIDDGLKDLIKEAIVSNTDVRPLIMRNQPRTEACNYLEPKNHNLLICVRKFGNVVSFRDMAYR